MPKQTSHKKTSKNPCRRTLTSGMNHSTTSCSFICVPILHRLSTALSVCSMAIAALRQSMQRLRRRGRSECRRWPQAHTDSNLYWERRPNRHTWRDDLTKNILFERVSSNAVVVGTTRICIGNVTGTLPNRYQTDTAHYTVKG